MSAAFPLLDPEDLDASYERWLRVTTPLVQGQRRTSAALAANYLTTFRSLETGRPSRGFAPVLADVVDTRALSTSLLVTGPISIRSALGRGVDLAKAMDVADARSAAAGMRHALNGGRETITGTVKADRRARGWARVTSGNACDFCSMLEERGVVYSEESADFEAHDGCQCSAEPAYE